MQSLDQTVLFEADTLRVVHRSASGRGQGGVAVTFTNWGVDPAANLKRGFAEGAFLQRGLDEILVQNGCNDWYQGAAIIDALGCIAERLTDYDRVLSYGASMGAYACLNFSRQLRADVCFAISPQFSVDPRKVPFETRWRAEAARIAFRHDDVNAALDPKTRHFVLFDPASRDRLHADLIDTRKAQKIGLRHSGHFTLNTIKELGLLDQFLGVALADGAGMHGFQRQYAHRIRTSPQRAVSLAEPCIKAPARLLRLAQVFRRNPPGDPVAYEKMGLYLILSRQFSLALKILHALPALDERAYAVALRARACAGMGDTVSAGDHARRVAELAGVTHDYCVQLRALGIVPRYGSVEGGAGQMRPAPVTVSGTCGSRPISGGTDSCSTRPLRPASGSRAR